MGFIFPFKVFLIGYKNKGYRASGPVDFGQSTGV